MTLDSLILLFANGGAGPRYKYVGEEGKQDRVLIPFNERYFVMYKQIYYSGRTCEEHGRDIKNSSIHEEFRSSFADHDAGDRAILEKEGVPTTKANKDVSAGIQSVYEGIGNNKLYILENSLIEYDTALEATNLPTKTEDEFSGYNRAKGKDGKYNPDEKPRKLNDHGMDTLRYFYHTLSMLHGAGGSFITGIKYTPRRMVIIQILLVNIPLENMRLETMPIQEKDLVTKIESGFGKEFTCLT